MRYPGGGVAAWRWAGLIYGGKQGGGGGGEVAAVGRQGNDGILRGATGGEGEGVT